MKNFYEEPKIQIVAFEVEDVLTESINERDNIGSDSSWNLGN